MKKTSIAALALLSLLAVAPPTFAAVRSSRDSEYRETRVRDREGFVPRLVRIAKRLGVIKPTTDLPQPPRP